MLCRLTGTPNNRAFNMRLLFLLALILAVAGCRVSTTPSAPQPQTADETRDESLEIEPVEFVESATPEVRGSDSASGARDLTPFVIGARASSLERDRFVAEHAFDGNRFTRWASAANDTEFIEAYFDRAVAISSITVRWERARAAVYKILGRENEDVWVELARFNQPKGLLDVFHFSPATTVTAIRIACEKRATEWGHSIYEVHMTGFAKDPPPTNHLIGFFPPGRNEKQQRERDTARRLMAQAALAPRSSAGLEDDEFLDLLEQYAFAYFWYETNPTNGLTRDRGANFDTSEDYDIASLAAVGFALSAYPIGVERGWITRAAGRKRTLVTLRTLARGNIRQIHGFFPHFVDMYSGKMVPGTEISTIDTALMLAGVIVAAEYFNDAEIRQLAKEVFDRVDWRAGAKGHPHFVSHGWDYEGHMLSSRWGSFTEGVLLYVLALGSTTYPLPLAAWDAIDRHTGEYGGYRFVVEHGFQSMFRYQYPALWYDFRGKTDAQGVDFFENATLAMLAMRRYCIDLAAQFPKSYGPDLWGLSAADGPGDMYMIFGFPPGTPYSPTDGTIVPYAIAGSLPFSPPHVIRALRKLYDDFRDVAWGKYGLADSINPTLDFVARDMIGIDAGTILLAIENHRSGMIWKLFMRSPWIRKFTQTIPWTIRPTPHDPYGPIDLARQSEWRMMAVSDSTSLPPVDDSRWQRVALPDFWENLGGPYANYDGQMWFETDFLLDEPRLIQWTRNTRPVQLTIGAVDDGDEAFVNGAKIGATVPDALSARLRRQYAVPLHLLRVGKNTVRICVTDVKGKGGIWLLPIEIGPAP